MCFTLVGPMYVKEVLLLMTGIAIDEDGSHHQQPYCHILGLFQGYLG